MPVPYLDELVMPEWFKQYLLTLTHEGRRELYRWLYQQPDMQVITPTAVSEILELLR